MCLIEDRVVVVQRMVPRMEKEGEGIQSEEEVVMQALSKRGMMRNTVAERGDMKPMNKNQHYLLQ